MIGDLENRIWDLEADVTAKERIILEKTEENNLIWGENLSQVTNMETHKMLEME